jgi:hypothetical protein
MVRKHEDNIAVNLDADNQDIYNSNARIQQMSYVLYV